MDVDVDSVETELNAYTRVQQVPLDTDPLMWWKQHVQEFPHLPRMTRQHLVVPATSVGIAIDNSFLSTINKILIDKLSIRSFCY
jgi:hypothetical protein